MSLDIIVHFQESDEVISNRDDQMYINKLTQTNLGNTSVIIGNDGGHAGLHHSLWSFYAEKLPEQEMFIRPKR